MYYLANKSDNIYFALLGDCTSSKNENEEYDEEIIKIGLEDTNRLNKKYSSVYENDFPKFSFLYRKRQWNPCEKCYIGWERKRGLICQFNEFLVDGINKFRINSLEEYIKDKEEKVRIPNIKYVITLDSDTNLVFGSGQELIGAMSHILNEPILDKNKNIVKEGHGLIQPRIVTNVESSRKSLFSKIFTGNRRDRFIYKCNFRYISR